ncbi:hypothetical protein H6G00_07550 [Leptolyngbya sp. FACHB-541]|uniref:type V CRISPR-associated protein Cas12k n=1 Tax=Leptolyngbya sp. FACHB-541 TaxID=2692810 RepID=UPI0016881F1B|nr:hypothetical protein [Leptolyngbya sp. FACHB-541]
MSIKTIRCSLCTDEATRKFFWEEMVAYTLLVNALFRAVAEDDKFKEWQTKGFVPDESLKKMIESFKKHSNSKKLPGRFYNSAARMTQYVYKSWFSLQRQRYFRMLGKKRWLDIVKQDYDLEKTTDFSSENICARAQEILEESGSQPVESNNRKPRRKSAKSSNSLLGELLTQFESTSDTLVQRAIIHLLKNNLQVSNEPEDPEKLKLQLESKQIEIERLEEQLKSCFPKGRDPTGERFAAILLDAVSLPNGDDADSIAEALSEWRQQKPINFFNTLPYPVLWGSADEFIWSTEPRSSSTNPEPSVETSSKKRKSKKKKKSVSDKICFRFSRLRSFVFKVQCDRRQLPVFRQFLADYQANASAPKEEHFSSSLFTLRSAQLIWQKDTNKRKEKKSDKSQSHTPDQPWATHRLYLHCTIDTHFLTAEGTEAVREQIKHKVANSLKEQDKVSDQEVEPLELTEGQKGRLKAKQTQLTRLENPHPPRPSKPNYQGDPLITVGVSLSRQVPLTVCVIDLRTGNVLENQTTKRLLTIHGIKAKRGKRSALQLRLEHWRLVNKLNLRRQRNLLQRKEEQKHDQYRENNDESNLGIYMERLLANRLVRLAIKSNAGSIAVPNLKHIREIIESDIRAKAKHKFPQKKELQDQYAKQLRASFHRWSYSRLVQFIQECATSQGIPVVSGQQLKQGSLQQKAVEVAMSAHRLPAL